MKIGIDIRILSKEKRTGVEDYTINLLSHLLSIDKSTRSAADKIKYRLFYNSFKKLKGNYPWLRNYNVKIKKLRIPNRIFDLSLRFLRFPQIDKLLGGTDIFFSPHFLLTPLSKKCKIVVIFYDLSFLRFPEFFSLPKLFWHKFIYPKKQAKKADTIIAISQSTKEDLIHLCRIPSEKIRVIYPGIDEKFKPLNKHDSNLIKVAKKYKLFVSPTDSLDKFILYFGTIEPRKNILGLIEAFEQIKKEKNFLPLQIQWQGIEGKVKKEQEKGFESSGLKLVITGSRGWLCKNVFERAKNSPFHKDIIFTGYVDEDDKPYLYNLADIFVYPSFFEGFGLPPLEAMACGVPTIVSNSSSLSEVVGDGAIMVDPHNINEISFAIRKLLENQELKKYLIKQGIRRTKQFDWDIAAKEFLQIFKQLYLCRPVLPKLQRGDGFGE